MLLLFCFSKKVSKKGARHRLHRPDEIGTEGALIKLLCYCSLRFSSLIVYHYLTD